MLGRLVRITGITTAAAAGTHAYYTRQTHFVPSTLEDYNSSALKTLNPHRYPPALYDHAVRVVPLSQLPTADTSVLTREFCRGVWGEAAYTIQRKYLERKYRAAPGREDNLWDVKDLLESAYPVGTKITDHFEVVESSPDKVVFRSGDSPLNRGPRETDGHLLLEVTRDGENATFHFKSYFLNTTEAGAKGDKMPEPLAFLHREYTKLLVESSVRRLLK